MAIITGADGKQYDTDRQSDRADLRKQGHYIDASGVYAPGSGQRIGDTFSGSLAGRNEAPSPTRLPIIGGTPISPSSGSTGPQTGAIMYRSDPQYAEYFGPGTPGYSSTSQTATAAPTAPVPGQGSLADYVRQQGIQAPAPAQPTAQAPLPAADEMTMGPMIPGGPEPSTLPPYLEPGGGGLLGGSSAASPPAAAPAPEAPQNPAYNPRDIQWNQPPQPASTGQVNPNQATGNPTAGQPGQERTTPIQPQIVDPKDPTRGGTFSAVMVGDQVVYVPNEMRDQVMNDQHAAADAAAQAKQFEQGIAKGRLDLDRAIAEYTRAHNDAIIAGQNADRAQQMALEAMRNDITKQGQELTRQANAQQAVYQQGVLENQRQQSAQTLSIEREKLSLQRQQLRGRRLPAVRFA